MSGVNVHISVTNLVQMDRHQSDTHRSPMINQEQNADVARQEAARKAIAPAQPDKVEGKKIDPKAKREEEERKKRRRARPGADGEKSGGPAAGSGSGRVIDFSA